MKVDAGDACDRCGLVLDGFGVLTGLVVVSLEGGVLTERIYCYLGGCRDAVLAGRVSHLSGAFAAACTSCGAELPTRSPRFAALAADLEPGSDSTSRSMTFCHLNGCAARLLGLPMAAAA